MSVSTYSPKVLELVAKEISGYFTGNEIVKILVDFGLKRDTVQYPNTKWWTINEAFKYIKQNYQKPDDEISRLVMIFIHPLQHNLNNEVAEKLVKQVEKYLKYDNFYIQDTGKEYLIFSSEEMDEIHSTPTEVIEKEEDNKKVDEEKIKRNAELIKTLRDNHQSLMDVVEIFCQNSKKPTKELNDAYIFLVKKIEDIIKQLELKHHKIYFYKPFKKDIYTAEYEWNGDGSIFSPIKLTPKLSWDAVRPHMYETHSKISEIYRMAEETEEMSDDEKRLEQINALISEKRTAKTTPKTEDVKRMEILHKYEDKKTEEKPIKIEISKIPDLNIKNVEDSSIVKGKKKIALPKFSPTAWSKVQIRFIDDDNVYITADKKTATADYEALGFRNDKNGKPNTAWKFLFELARNNGETQVIPSPIPDAIKNQKRVLSDRLKTIFKNDTDPFDDFSQSKTYKIKIRLIPPSKEQEKDKYGIRDYLDETMTNQYEAN